MPKTEKTAPADAKQKDNTKTQTPIVSAIGPSGEIIETVFDTHKERAQLAVWKDGHAHVLDQYCPSGGERFVPARSAAALVEHNVLRFAQAPMSYGSIADLVDAIRAYIHKYVDVSEAFERLSANYVLFTWVHDRFNELPYLRRRGDYGTGKTRFLTVVGSICYKPIFAGGASTTSPIFHLLDQVAGTLVIDEADFRFSDESALIAKILNAGNVKGYPVLRSVSTNGKDYRPRAFKVFGPKIVGMRGRYDDPALESRFLTETSSNPSIRKDIPINLPSEQEADASVLRNKLLLYRFENFHRFGAPKPIDTALYAIEPRMHQILAPLLSVAEDETDREAILAHASAAQTALAEARGQTLEAEVLTVIKKQMSLESGPGVSVQAIANDHGRAFQDQTTKALSPRAMGHVLRTRLNLKTTKSHGVFIVPKLQGDVLERLYARYSVSGEDVAILAERLGETSRLDFGDVGEEAGKVVAA
tara:strand:+ start:31296 stop:32720 length:1425 start_codon:yes stop_codon:yes gene_type:complete